MNITFEEIFALHKKEACIRRFQKSYHGSVMPTPDDVYSEGSRFFSAHQETVDLGFIRISNKTNMGFASNDVSLWCASDVYVRKEYRSQGVLKKLLHYVINNCDVKLIFIKRSIFNSNREYYSSMNFNKIIQFPNDSELIWIMRE